MTYTIKYTSSTSNVQYVCCLNVLPSTADCYSSAGSCSWCCVYGKNHPVLCLYREVLGSCCLWGKCGSLSHSLCDAFVWVFATPWHCKYFFCSMKSVPNASEQNAGHTIAHWSFAYWQCVMWGVCLLQMHQCELTLSNSSPMTQRKDHPRWPQGRIFSVMLDDDIICLPLAQSLVKMLRFLQWFC